MKPPKKLSYNSNSERKEKLECFLNERLPEGSLSWGDFKLLFQEAADHTDLERKKCFLDWFDDQDKEIKKLLRDKKLNNQFRKRRKQRLIDFLCVGRTKHMHLLKNLLPLLSGIKCIFYSCHTPPSHFCQISCQVSGDSPEWV